jgi:hypothetical protein
VDKGIEYGQNPNRAQHRDYHCARQVEPPCGPLASRRGMCCAHLKLATGTDRTDWRIASILNL